MGTVELAIANHPGSRHQDRTVPTGGSRFPLQDRNLRRPEVADGVRPAFRDGDDPVTTMASESLTTISWVSVVTVVLAAGGSEASSTPTGPVVGPTAEEVAAGSAGATALAGVIACAKAATAAVATSVRSGTFAAGSLTMRSVVERIGDGMERPVRLFAVPG